MLLDKAQVMKFLPHRDPFLFIDTVKEVILPPELEGQKGPFTTAQMVGVEVFVHSKLIIQ